MTIKFNAKALMDEVLEKRGLERRQYIDLLMPTEEALCHAVELLEQEKVMHAERLLAMDARTTTAETQHEATKQELSDFRQEVSKIVSAYVRGSAHDAECEWENLKGLIISAPKLDPLEDALDDMGLSPHYAEEIRAALDALGFEIREKNDG